MSKKDINRYLMRIYGGPNWRIVNEDEVLDALSTKLDHVNRKGAMRMPEPESEVL